MVKNFSVILLAMTISASAQDATRTLRFSQHQLLYYGTLLDKEKCSVGEVTAGTCEALQMHNDMQAQLNQQAQDELRRAQGAQQSAFDKAVADKAAAEAKKEPQP